jgi:hypothetical protein
MNCIVRAEIVVAADFAAFDQLRIELLRHTRRRERHEEELHHAVDLLVAAICHARRVVAEFEAAKLEFSRCPSLRSTVRGPYPQVVAHSVRRPLFRDVRG